MLLFKWSTPEIVGNQVNLLTSVREIRKEISTIYSCSESKKKEMQSHACNVILTHIGGRN